MYERFTDRARKVMQLAGQEAQRFNHEYIGTEHLLLALVKLLVGVGDDSTSASIALRKMNLDPRRIRVEIEKIMKAGPEFVTAARLPLTPYGQRVVDYAKEEAHDLKQEGVETGHLLIGLVRETEGVAGRVLANMGVSLEVVRREVERATERAVQESPTEAGKSEVQGSAVALPFTDGARGSMLSAAQEAQRLNHQYIGTEHMLLALVKDEAGDVAKVLKALGVEPGAVRAELERILEPGPEILTPARLPHTPPAKRAIECTIEEARALGHRRVGNGALLLGLLRSEESVAAQVLRFAGVALDAAREQVRRAGEPEPPPSAGNAS